MRIDHPLTNDSQPTNETPSQKRRRLRKQRAASYRTNFALVLVVSVIAILAALLLPKMFPGTFTNNSANPTTGDIAAMSFMVLALMVVVARSVIGYLDDDVREYIGVYGRDYEEKSNYGIEREIRALRLRVYELEENKANNANAPAALDNHKSLGVYAFEDARKRLVSEIQSLGRRGNVNLVIGIMTAIVSVTILYLVASNQNSLSSAEANGDLWKIFLNYAPRLSLSFFAGLIAFFFLQIYKNILAEIKYFQNELTGLECKFMALQLAIEIEDKESVSLALKQLALVERNFILKKDETTIELERLRLESSQTEKIITAIAALPETLKGKLVGKPES